MISLGFLASTLGFTPAVYAQASNSTIQVVGTASVELKPDEVYFSVGVSSEYEVAADAMQKVQKVISDVLSSLKANKQIKELNTEYVSLQRHGNYKTKTAYCSARQNISFVLTDLDQYDALLLELLDKGINELGNIQFRSSIAEQEREKLIAGALEDAKAKATSMAAQYGQKVGKALHISDVDQTSNNPRPMVYKSFAEGANMSSIVGGNLKLEVQVYVEFELK